MTASPIALLGATPIVARDQHRPWPAVGEQERKAVARVLDRGVLSGSSAPETVSFEREFASFVGARHALLTHSGTSALCVALAAAGISAGDHVIVPAYSFVATPLSVLQAGAIPIFADVDPVTGLLGADNVEAVATSRTRAIMPVHVHGCAAELGPLFALAKHQNWSVVEDAAQAHGATFGGMPVGALGSCGGFSLQSSKNLSAGEGGVFVTNSDELALQAHRIRNFGQDVTLAERDSFDADRPLDGTRALVSGRMGAMFRGNELMAAFARAQLAQLGARTCECQAHAATLCECLRNLPGVSPPVVPPGSTSVHHKFRVAFDPAAAGLDLSPRQLRDVMLWALAAEGVEVVLWQTAPLSAQPVFQSRAGFGDGWPWSADQQTDFAAQYDPARFQNTQRLLDCSVVLFSQSCPLIAQTSPMVDRYCEAFSRVWQHRGLLVDWAKKNLVAQKAVG